MNIDTELNFYDKFASCSSRLRVISSLISYCDDFPEMFFLHTCLSACDYRDFLESCLVSELNAFQNLCNDYLININK